MNAPVAGGSGHRFDVVPVTALLDDERFQELTGVTSEELETVRAGDRSMFLRDLLAPARETTPRGSTGWGLLAGRRAVVPFMGRDEELDELRSWAADPDPVSIAVLTGRAGTGKTRLAVELCAELAEAGWDTGFLPLDAVHDLLSGEAGSRGDMRLEASRATLVVVDRPEPSYPLVGELVRRLAKDGRIARVRLLFLVGEPGETDWWRRLDTASGGWLRRLTTTTVGLNARPLTLPERTEHALAAMKAFAPDRDVLPDPPRLEDPEYGLPLHVHLAALLCVRGEDPPEQVQGNGGLLEHIVTHELTRSISDGPAASSGTTRTDPEALAEAPTPPDGLSIAGLPRTDETTTRQALATLLLTTPDHDELPAVLSVVTGIRDGALAGLVADVRVTPEAVAGELLAGTAGLGQLATALRDREGCTVEQLVRLIDVLRRSAGREPVGAALRTFLTGRLDELVATAVAHPHTRLADVLGDALSAAFDGDTGEPGSAVTMSVGSPGLRRGVGLGLQALQVALAGLAVRHRRAYGERVALAAALTWQSGALAAVGRLSEAVAAAAEAVDLHAAAPAHAVTPPTAAPSPTASPREEEDGQAHVVGERAQAEGGRAEALFALGAGLLMAGEGVAALRPAQEAADVFRDLAAEDSHYAGEAARAHYNLACALLDAGRLGEAVAAFGAAGGDAGFAAHVTEMLAIVPPPSILPDGPGSSGPSDLPGTFTALGAFGPSAATGGSGGSGGSGGFGFGAAEVGRTVTPVAAFEEMRADEVLPDLAACLAVAATQVVRAVAPGGVTVGGGVVVSRMRWMAGWLEARGRVRDAVVPAGEAVGRLRGLADGDPGVRAQLASAAADLAGTYARLDDLDAAVRSAAEAVRNLRALVTLEPDEHRPSFTGQLLVLGELLLADGRPEEALAPLQEARISMTGSTTHAEIPNTGPVTRGGQVEVGLEVQARARYLLGLCLDELGRRADARVQLEIAAELYDVHGGRGGPSDEVRARLGRMEPAEPQPGEPWLPGLTVTQPARAVARAEERLAECRKAVEDAGTPGAELVDAYLSAQAGLATALADAGRAGDGLALATQAAELLQRHAAPGPPHAIAVGMVAAALGRALVGLGRHKEALPHLLTAVESYEPQAELSVAFRTELAHLLTLETVALSRAASPADAAAASDRLAELYAGLVAEGAEPPLALAGALHVQASIRFGARDAEGALRSVTRALDAVPSPQAGEEALLLTAACLELGGLCLAELGDDDAARDRLARGTALMTRAATVPCEVAGVHLRALVRLARLRVEEDGPAAGAALFAGILDMRPLPGVEALGTLVDELSGLVTEMTGTAGLAGPLSRFAEALEREVPLSGAPELHARYARCLAAFGAAAARGGDDEGALLGAELAVRVYRGLAVVSGAYREALGVALAQAAVAYERCGRAELPVLEQAVDLLGGRPGRLLGETLLRYAAELFGRGRPAESLAHCERAADVCDDLDEPSLAAAVYVQLGATLAALGRPLAALDAITWALAELDRAAAGVEVLRARAIQVRGEASRASGREPEAMAHLVEALRLFTALPDQRGAAATAALIADDLLAAGRPREAVEYAGIAAAGEPPGTVRHAEAAWRLARCRLALGDPAGANALAEDAIRTASAQPGDVAYRTVLAGALTLSSETLLRPDGVAGALLRQDGVVEAEARAREAVAVYDELIAAGVDARDLHIGRAGACLALAGALLARQFPADAVGPLREAVAALERFPSGGTAQAGLLSRAMLMLGDALMRADRPLEAGLVLHRAAQVAKDAPTGAVAHARLGLCQLDLGRDDAADEALQTAAALLRTLTAQDADPRAQGDHHADLLREVLRGRLSLLEKAGREQEAQAIDAELRHLDATP
ncbi:hypothetical protein SAMN05421874_106313 [Nonomuraea maritima]|uniref:Tetratricopeptide repeat-containing protein n=1 Tax=Nonomuraea maritima TaxID=683260 RepID=A0A1G9ARI8_9ACTN|nr:hypothetical protein [Nonomuraea maritima]SDK29863.1 hypothetical protein SAMN05421874_106313 [Nonomuraea maritima]